MGVLSSCSLPRTAMRKDNAATESMQMPLGTLTKVVVTSNISTLVRNPVTGNRRRLWMLRKRSEIAAGVPDFFTSVDENYRNTHSIEDFLDKIELPKRVAGNVDYLIDGEAFFDALQLSMDRAKNKIDARVFTLDNDDVAVAFSDHFKERSEHVKAA